LLNISRLRTGNLVLELSPVNLAELIEQEVSQLQAAAGLRGIKLIYKKPKDFPELMLDETKIRQVIMNFLDNALFYTPAKGKIIVTLENTARNVQFQVEDSGIGVPEAMQPRLFSKYYRAPNARKVRPDGMGLGLYMAKKIVIAHLGALIFRSQEAKGSTFGFTLNKSKLKVLDTSTKPTK
jgi:signal transduction histidine kinase